MVEVKYFNDCKKIYILNEKKEVIKVILIGKIDDVIKSI